MNKKFLAGLAMGLFIIGMGLGIEKANATIITFTYSGTVKEVNDPSKFGGAVVGDKIHGYFTFDSTTTPHIYAPWLADYGEEEYIAPPYQLVVQVGTLSVTLPYMIIVSNSTNQGGIYQVDSTNQSGDWMVNMEVVGTASITSIDLPLTPPSLTVPLTGWRNINLWPTPTDFFGRSYLRANWDTLEIASTALNVHYFNQSDQPWGPQEYDTAYSLEKSLNCGTTIAQCGCALTSAAMILKYYGVDRNPEGEPTTPETLNKWLKENSGYIFGSIKWPSVASYSFQVNKNFGTPMIRFSGIIPQEDKSRLNDELNNRRPVILEEPGHFIVATGILGLTYSINDPGWKQKSTLEAYNNNFRGMRLYEPTSTDLSTIYISAPVPTQIFFVDELGRRVGQDPNTGIIYNEIPNSFYFIEPALIDDTLEYTPSPPEDSGVTTLAIINPPTGSYNITVLGFDETYSISFAGYDKDGAITTQDFKGKQKNYILNYSPEPGAQIDVVQIVSVDIKPGSDTNSIKLGAEGVIPVAVLTTNNFDASTVNPFSIVLEGGTVKLKGKSGNTGFLEDIDSDGDLDLVVHITDWTLTEGQTTATLTGQTFDGKAIKGSDSIRVIP